jgi:MFS family permease
MRSVRVHRAWIVAGVAFVALVGAAGFRATPGVLMVPLQEEFGWSRAATSLAVSVNLILFGLTAPFAAALMDRFGIRRVTAVALVLVAAGSGLTIFMNATWQLVLCWGVLVGLGTGSMAAWSPRPCRCRSPAVRPPRRCRWQPDLWAEETRC